MDVLDQMKSVFLQNQMNDLILDMLREIRQLENDIKLNEVDYKAKIWKKKHNFRKISFSIILLMNMHTGFLSVEDTDKEQSKLLKELNDLNKGDKPFENKPFLKSVGFLFDVREKVLNSFKSDIFPIKNLGKIPTPKEIPNSKLEPTLNPAVSDTPKITKAQTKKSKHMTSPLQLRGNFVNMVVNDKKTKIMKNSGNILDIRIHYFCQNI